MTSTLTAMVSDVWAFAGLLTASSVATFTAIWLLVLFFIVSGALKEALRTFVTEVEAGRQQDATGLDPETQAPFLGIARQEMAHGADRPPNDPLPDHELVEHIHEEIPLVGFWQNAHAQTLLRTGSSNTRRDVLPIERLLAKPCY